MSHLVAIAALAHGACQSSKSQWGEEKLVSEHLLRRKRNGTYVEIGAVDGAL